MVLAKDTFVWAFGYIFLLEKLMVYLLFFGDEQFSKKNLLNKTSSIVFLDVYYIQYNSACPASKLIFFAIHS